MGNSKELEEKPKYYTRKEVLKMLDIDTGTYYIALKKLDIEPRKMRINGRLQIVLTEEEVNRLKSITDVATILRNFYDYENTSPYQEVRCRV